MLLKGDMSIMNKIAAFLLAVMMICLSGCSGQENSYQSYIDEILELDSFSYPEEIKLNHKNIVSLRTESSINPDATAKIDVKILNQNYKFHYEETLTFPVRDETVDSYLLEGAEEEQRILLTQNGEIRSILFKFARIEIESDADINEVFDKLKPILEKFIDLSDYKHVNMTGNTEKRGESFGFYDYLFFNEINGYMSDYCKVAVTDEGYLLGFSNISLDVDMTNLQLNIDKKWEDKLISEKLKDMFSTSETEYISYHFDTRLTPQIVQYEGELYIQYWVSAQYTHFNSEISSGLFGLLIPVHLLCDRTVSCETGTSSVVVGLPDKQDRHVFDTVDTGKGDETSDLPETEAPVVEPLDTPEILCSDTIPAEE